MYDEIAQNIRHIRQRINSACELYGRDKDEVKLLLATKTVSVDKIKAAIDLGHDLIGENKVLEGIEKYDLLKNNNCQWHLIGHLQTNKIKHALRYVDLIQSVDRMKLAEKLNNRCKYENKDVDIFIQVNTSNEISKFGIEPETAIEFIKQVSDFDRLHIKGLMTIGLLSSKSDAVRDCFKRLKEIQVQAMELHIPNASFNELSMGMSDDLELAIAEGSTMIRIGTAIFGERPYPDSYYWNENSDT
ncbi:MAG: YggS family pyridoxal phosphate-dependent enzyme [Flavipsychrobacter sp.]